MIHQSCVRSSMFVLDLFLDAWNASLFIYDDPPFLREDGTYIWATKRDEKFLPLLWEYV